MSRNPVRTGQFDPGAPGLYVLLFVEGDVIIEATPAWIGPVDRNKRSRSEALDKFPAILRDRTQLVENEFDEIWVEVHCTRGGGKMWASESTVGGVLKYVPWAHTRAVQKINHTYHARMHGHVTCPVPVNNHTGSQTSPGRDPCPLPC